jgi:hypothetical protein
MSRSRPENFLGARVLDRGHEDLPKCLNEMAIRLPPGRNSAENLLYRVGDFIDKLASLSRLLLVLGRLASVLCLGTLGFHVIEGWM